MTEGVRYVYPRVAEWVTLREEASNEGDTASTPTEMIWENGYVNQSP